MKGAEMMKWRTFVMGTVLALMLMPAMIPGVVRADGATAKSHATAGATDLPDFGPNVKIFDPSMPVSEIQATVNAIAAQQVSNQFGPQRYALLFKPGTYGTPTNPLNFQVGYYTEVAGLGRELIRIESVNFGDGSGPGERAAGGWAM